MMKIITIISYVINTFFITAIFIILKNKKSRELLAKELEDEKAFKDFFNDNRIDF